MIDTLSTAMTTALNTMNRGFAAATGYTGGFAQLMQDILTTLSQGNIGITAVAGDVDSVSLGGGAFTWDKDNTSGLTFAYKAGRVYNGLANVSVGASTIALSASNTNYVEVDRTGTVFTNTTGFTSGRTPLYSIVTSSSAITTVTSAKALLAAFGPTSVNGVMLSAVASTKTMQKDKAAISATTSFFIIAPCTGAISNATFVSDTAITANDTNYWTWSITNKGASNAGTQPLLDSGSENTTKATGGSSLAVNVPRSLQLVTLSGGTERNVTKGDVLVVTLTMTGTATTIANSNISLDFGFPN